MVLFPQDEYPSMAMVIFFILYIGVDTSVFLCHSGFFRFAPDDIFDYKDRKNYCLFDMFQGKIRVLAYFFIRNGFYLK